MSSFAIFIVILVVVAGALGWRSGFVSQIGKLAGVVLGIAACRIFGQTVADMLCGAEPSATDRVLYTILAYVLVFIVVYVAVPMVARLVHSTLKSVHLGIVDSIAGAVFRITEWLVLLSLLLNLWQGISPIESLADDAVFARVLWFGPYLLGTDAALKVGSAVSTAITG